MKSETKRQKFLFQGKWIRPALIGVFINLLALSSVFAQTSSAAKLLFLGNKNIAPVVYLDKTTPTGVAVDIVRALAPHLPQPIEIKAVDWLEAQALVARGEADALIQINPSEERKKIYDFSEPLLASQFSIFTRTDKVGISGISSLFGMQVGVEAGGLPQQLLEKYPAIRLTIIPDFLTGFKLLSAGGIDAVVVDYRVGSYVIAENKLHDIRVSGEPIAFSYSAIAVREGNTKLLGAINNALQIIKTDGSYQKIIDNWKPKEVVFETREQVTQRVYYLTILLLLVLTLMAVIWTLTVRSELAKRKAAEGRLQAQYSTLRGIINSANALIFSVDRQYRYTSFNLGHAASMKALYGAQIELGQSLLDYMSVTEDRETARHNLDRALAGEQVVKEAFSGEELRSRQYFQVSHSPIRSEEGVMGVAVLAQDMSERRRAEEALQRLNRELRAISDCNQVLVRAEDEPTLLNDICRIVCEKAGYRMAWVGYAENDAGKTIKPVAWAGVEEGYLAEANITWADTERGNGPGGTAIRSGRTVHVQDFATDPQTAPWRDPALQRGYHSCIALPLKDETAKVFGVLLIYSAEINAFSPDEIRLLEELAGDLAFGIMVLRTRTEHKQAEQALRRLTHLQRTILDNVAYGVISTNSDGMVTSFNPAAERLLGYTADEVVDKQTPAYWHDPEEVERHAVQLSEELGEVIAPGFDTFAARPRRNLPEENEWTFIRKDGKRIPVNLSVTALRDEGGQITGFVGLTYDLSERKRAEAQLRRSERGLAEAQRIAHLGNWELDLATSVLTWSDEVYRIFEIDPKKFGASYDAFLNVIHPEDREMVNKVYTDSVKDKVPYDIVHRLQLADGRIKYVNEKCETYYGADGKPLRSVGTVHDITERKLDEEALQRLNRELRAISNCNQILIRAEDEQTLLDAICHIVSDEAGYRMAWVGYAENDEAKSVRPVAWAGVEDGYLAQLGITWADTERGHGPAGTTIRSGKSNCRQDFSSDPGAAPWHDSALQRGYRSCLSLPLKDESEHTFGVLSMYATELNAFTPGEVRLLEGLAGDLAFGILVLRTRNERKRVEENLRRMNERYSLSTHAAGLGVWDWDLQKDELVWDERMYELYGVKREDFAGAYEAWLKGLHPDDRAASDEISIQARRGEREYDTEFRVVWPDGSVHCLKAYGQFVRDAQGTPIRMTGVNYDITEIKQAEASLRDSEEEYRTLIQKIQAAVIVHGPDTKILTSNTMAQNILGLSQEQLLGKTAIDPAWHFFREDGTVAPPDEYPVSRVQASRKALRNYILGVHRPNQDNDAWVLVNADPVFGKEDELTQIIVTFIDISERKRVEDALSFVAQCDWQTSGESFFDALAQFLGEKLDMDYVLIDRLDENQDMAETVAFYAKGAITPNMRYALKGTPCENVMGRRLCVYPHGIQQLFPEDTLLPGMGAESYVGIPLWDSTGQPIGLIAVMGNKPLRDDAPVTQLLQLVATRAAAELERERSNRLLRAREHEFRTLAANLPDNVVRYDLEGRTVYVNPVLEETLGADAARMLGRRIREYLPDGSYEAYAQAVDAALASGKNGEIELTLPVPGTEPIVHQIRMIVERDEQGEVSGLLAIGRDITELKRAEEALQERERHSQSLLRLSRNLEHSQTYAEVLHAAQGEVATLIGYQNLWVYLLSEDKAHMKALVASGPESGVVMSEEGTATLTIAGDKMLEEIAQAKEIVVVEDAQTDPRVNKEIVARLANRTIVNVPIVLSGRHLGTVGVGTFGAEGVRIPSASEQRYLSALASHLAAALDRIQLLAARKKDAQELLRYKDHLEEQVQHRTADLVLARNAAEAANRAKSVFLSSMSHELRTPLNAVLGFSSMMRKDPLLQIEQRQNLDIINRSGEHLLNLINDVLEMAKIEAGRVQVERAPFDLGSLVRDVTDMMHVRAREKGLKLRIDQSSEFPRYIRGDQGRLRQVLINLLGNAVKFTRQGGIAVRFGLKPLARPQRLLIEVQDSGIGISEDDQKRVFEPFVQFGETAAQQGTGLGLSISRQFVQLMGGTISFESTLGKGSTFRLELPLERVAAADVLKPQGADGGEIVGLAPDQPIYRILIVEDQLDNQLLLTKLMKNVGFEVKVAPNGAQALDLFQSWRPHLIWMDRRMPVMDGLEATRCIRELPAGAEVKIVAVTASVFTEQRDEMLQAGMDDFVRKPYRFNEIYECMARQLGVRYRYAQARAEEEVSNVVLTSEMLAPLSPDWRSELHDALESLDGERISAVMAQIASLDSKLHKTLSQLIGNFDYPAILKALQTNQPAKPT